jgi:hypothetical protein
VASSFFTTPAGRLDMLILQLKKLYTLPLTHDSISSILRACSVGRMNSARLVD